VGADSRRRLSQVDRRFTCSVPLLSRAHTSRVPSVRAISSPAAMAPLLLQSTCCSDGADMQIEVD
jgi:hypothetical protein